MTETPTSENRRGVQFSIRTLLIAATIIGPLLGLYGPAAYSLMCDTIWSKPKPDPALQRLQAAQMQLNRIRSKMQQMTLEHEKLQYVTDAEELSKARALIQLQNQRIKFQLQQLDKRLQPSVSPQLKKPTIVGSIERGMKADELQRKSTGPPHINSL